MTQSPQLREIKPGDDLSLIGQWFVGDTEGTRHMASYTNPEEWRRLFGPSRRGWFFSPSSTGHTVGFIDLEIDGETGYFSYYVAPESRGAGYGTQTLRALVGLAQQLGLGELRAGVEPDNAASIAALKKAGFELLAPDEEDMFPVVMRIVEGEVSSH